MVLAGLLVVALAAAHVLRRPSAWCSRRERAAWLAVLVTVVPLLFLSIVGPLAALLAVTASAARATAGGGSAAGARPA
jgi:hypothetical protein